MILSKAIEIYKTYRAYAFLAGVNNVVCLYKDKKFVFDERVADYVIYGGHQDRVVKGKYFKYKHDTLEPAEKILVNSFPILKIQTDFDSLHAAVKKLIGGIKGISDLTIYDAALRLGFLIEVFPQKKVYVYSGAWDGLKELQKDQKALFTSRPFTKPGVYNASSFPSDFKKLDSMFIEDFLCVFHKELGHLSTCTKEDLLKSMEFHGTQKTIKNCFTYNYDIK